MIAVVAGTYDQAVCHARENEWGRENRDWFYVRDVWSLRGRNGLTIQQVGTCYDRRDYDDIFDEIVRLRSRGRAT